ncbi:MAG: 1,4-dihydroxy-2-naphthoate octaprenyltransferase [Winogradskyella sp.]|nr:1,4-dihydroxy-2-naphthoate octaprenyltransferase [Winogradskyella sp.]MBT8375759.1 1,4-dihydroxy-2-naphthoate octaprenyltransferase [Bacteroidia bacterium]NNC46356.1 1,4-dihydroxy-2-naphthoate octaprenyltransferase [Winogradskyella sp.]NNF86620.1 1,4-dihydroxy-2-naphthoate octaprenyltransferase [Winogradskyella sp.]NNK40201.1 1,4-dihydroxy-2-naphthoate octaprenyltransferase [Winogradskyella sp.]
MRKIRPWLSAMRLRTLPLSISGIVIGACMAHYNGAFNLVVFIIAILTTVSLQILSNLANDYGDGLRGTDNHNRVGPQRAIQSGKITPDEMFEAIKVNIIIIIFLVLALIYAAFGWNNYLFILLFVALGVLSVYAALHYTMGDSPYGYRALGDVFVFIFFGFISVIGSYLLFTKQLDHLVFLPAVALGLLSVGVLNLNNMRDLESDKSSGKITMAVKLGINKAKQYHYFLIISAMVISTLFAILYYVEPYNLLFFIAFVPLLLHLQAIKKASKASDFDGQLKILALTTFVFSLLLGLGYILY